ncbi:MAG: transglutaminase domain-containing protein [Oscillospiraceae bacterium]|nr:transglutaminase domain-containing protein [Oscillospiraceae bacterium]
MKRLLCMIIAVFIVFAALPGCGPDSGTADVPDPQEDQSAVPSENTETDDTYGGQSGTEITKDMALEGVGNYCRLAYGWTGGDDDGSYLTSGDETDSEHTLIFRSYTGTVVTFFIEKAGGSTRITEYVPILGTETEAGTIDLFDYIGIEVPDVTYGPDDPPEQPDAPPKKESHYVFTPKVCSVFMEEVFGEIMCETWYNLVDAVMAGEDTFACPDQYTYDWVMGQFPRRCFPILPELIDYAYDRSNSVVDGVASFTYLVSPEEAAARIAEFGELVEGILNEVLEDDYSDMEKALALYDYFSKTYIYDYETADLMYVTAPDYTSPYRLLTTGTGICSEISPAYSYLLMQTGVEATTVMGGNHEWSYVRINGNEYHIDPTFALSDPGTLCYFMMTDEQRDYTGYGRDEYVYVSLYSEDNPHPDYAADDDTFSPLWDYCYLDEILADDDTIRSWHYAPDWEMEFSYFSYAGF